MDTTLAITAVHNVTAVGHDAVMTAASVHAGIVRMIKSDDHRDALGEPCTIARVVGLFDEIRDQAERMAHIAAYSLERMLAEYFGERVERPASIRLYLGEAPEGRPGPRYGRQAAMLLAETLAPFAKQVEIETVAQGNAAVSQAIAGAGPWLQSQPWSICIVGALDSLLDPLTFGWIRHQGRVQSESPNCSQGLVPSQAAGFLVLESAQNARRDTRPVLATVRGVGMAVEPGCVVSETPSTGQGLTQAIREALTRAAVAEKDITAIYTDNSGEIHLLRDYLLALSRELPGLLEREDSVIAPAFRYGAIGAASGAVLTGIAVEGLRRGRVRPCVAVICTDDHGACGAVVLGG